MLGEEVGSLCEEITLQRQWSDPELSRRDSPGPLVSVLVRAVEERPRTRQAIGFAVGKHRRGEPMLPLGSFSLTDASNPVISLVWKA